MNSNESEVDEVSWNVFEIFVSLHKSNNYSDVDDMIKFIVIEKSGSVKCTIIHLYQLSSDVIGMIILLFLVCNRLL